MQVLVAAVRADAGSTSEGACTARVVRLLADRGHQVRLLVAAQGPMGSGSVAARAAVGAGVEVVEVDPVASRIARLGLRIAARGGRYRADLPVQVATGFGTEDLAAVAAWRAALQAEEAARPPDVTFVRGAGLDLQPVLARAGWAGAWVAHLHDPWPISWYPASYAQHARLVAVRQEAAARRVLHSAPAFTAPSARLFDWMVERSGVSLGGRAHVVAHAGPLVAEPAAIGEGGDREADLLPDRPFVLCHTGTLLGPRDPRPLLEAFVRFLGARPDAAGMAGLALVGPVDRRHRTEGPLNRLVARGRDEGWLALHDERVAPERARAASAAATVGVVIEAADPVSPFLPAKLADLLAGGGPILCLSPQASAAADLLGAEHPLRADPTDLVGIAAMVERAWERWRAGTLDQLLPAAASRRAVEPDVVGAALERAFEAAVSRAARR